MAIHVELEKLYQDDKRDRDLWKAGKLTDTQVRQNDEFRLKEIRKLLDQQDIDLN